MEPFIDVPTWRNGEWSITSFKTRDDYKYFVLSLFKEPGKYEFDETSFEFNSQARKFRKNDYFCPYPEGSKDFKSYWNDQRDKCRFGVIFHGEKNTWYLPREYYMWINFLPIYHKVKKKLDFPEVWDGQYHMALYELLAELHYKHCAVLKKRQFGASFYHCAKLINQIWFEEGPILKIGASLKDYINDKGSWKFLNEYKSFLDSKTAWYRPMNPGKVLMWQQQILDTDTNGRESLKGLKGTMQGVSFEQSDTAGVGGAIRMFFYEEAGIAPSMDKTIEYLFPALESGDITSGLFIASGSVGDLDQCEPLKELMNRPVANSIYPVTSNLLDEKGTVGITGLFIPEQWCMPPYMDEYGNSQVEIALKALEDKFEQWKKDLSPEKYQLRISQHPRNIAEAFAHRSVSVFPQNLVAAQRARIEDKQYPQEFVDLERDLVTNKILIKKSNKLPITEFPIRKDLENKEGVIVIYERPIDNPKLGLYYGSIDPVSEGKAEHVDNILYTPTGRKRIGDIKVGDKVMGSNGKSINVIGVYPQGIKKLCKITFSDRHSIIVCEDHLWDVKLNGGTKGYITLSVKDLLDKTKKITYTGIGRNIKKEYTISTYYKNNKRNKWSIPILKNPIEFNIRKELPIKPYLLGLLLGDGGISGRAVKFSSIDEELIINIKNHITDDLIIKKIKNSNCDYSITTKKGVRNSLTKKLRNLKLQGKRSEFKFIPEIYKYTSVQNRLFLLKGLMDTDGSCTNHGTEFYSSSKQLAYDVVELVQSLGGISKIRMKKTTHLDSYIVRVILPKGMNPFSLSRKKEKYKPSKVFSRYITNIEYVKDDEAVCISVDSSDNLYITEHALVTHNTKTSDSLCSIYIYKTPHEVTKVSAEKTETILERDGIVASWTGRFDDINKTHERLEMILELYNAQAIIENNVSLFIQHMIHKKKQKHMVPKNQILFLKDISSNTNVFQEYGWKNTGTIFKGHLLSYLIEYLKEEIDVETKPDGTIVKVTYGIERIPDLMAMVEMAAYNDDINVDRLVALTALIAFAKVQQANRGYTRTVQYEGKKDLQKSEKLYKITPSAFKNIGMGNKNNNQKPPRNPFKNLH